MYKRLFIAVEIPVSQEIIDIKQKLKEKLKNEHIAWVSLQNYHLSLKFLGDTDEKQIPLIIKVLEQTIKNYQAFEIKIKGLGKFTSAGKVKVIWLGVENKNQDLKNIAQQLNEKLTSLGFKAEKRKFNPHLTLARVKNIHTKALVDDLIKSYSSFEFQKITVKTLVLYESILKPTGAVYKSIARISI